MRTAWNANNAAMKRSEHLGEKTDESEEPTRFIFNRSRRYYAIHTGHKTTDTPPKSAKNSTAMFDGQRERKQMPKATKQETPQAMEKTKDTNSKSRSHAGHLAASITGCQVSYAGPHG